MTNVRMSPSLLAYRMGMAELVHRAREERTCAGVEHERLLTPAETRRDTPGLSMPGVLEPPRVEEIFADIRLTDGHLEGIIQIHTSDDYGVMNVFVTLKDEWGNLLESDYAMNRAVYGDHWGYMPSASLPPGTTVIVQAMALDFLGGAGLLTERVTVRSSHTG